MTAFERYFQHRGALGRALDPRTHTIEWLDQLIWTGGAQLWADDDAVLVTEIKTYPTGALELHAMIAAGNAQTVAEILAPQAEQWAREIGCMFCSVASRPGWSRVLQGRGYEVHQTYLRKEL